MFWKKDIHQVLRQENFYPIEGYCLGNALSAALIWMRAMHQVSEIHNALLPELGPHAYLVIDQKPYSRGVTWPDEKYRELTYSELFTLEDHQEVSTFLAFSIWTSITGNDAFLQELGYKFDNRYGMKYGGRVYSPKEMQKFRDSLFQFGTLCARRDGKIEAIRRAAARSM